MKWLGRALLSIAAVVPLWMAVSLQFALDIAGFPDSHLTEYDLAMKTPGMVMVGASLATAGGLVLCSLRVRTRRGAAAALALLAGYVVVFEAARFVVDWYLKDHLGLDYGLGG